MIDIIKRRYFGKWKSEIKILEELEYRIRIVKKQIEKAGFHNSKNLGIELRRLKDERSLSLKRVSAYKKSYYHCTSHCRGISLINSEIEETLTELRALNRERDTLTLREYDLISKFILYKPTETYIKVDDITVEKSGDILIQGPGFCYSDSQYQDGCFVNWDAMKQVKTNMHSYSRDVEVITEKAYIEALEEACRTLQSNKEAWIQS